MLPQCRSTESPPESGPPKTKELNFLDEFGELICQCEMRNLIKTKFACVLLYTCVFHFATVQAHLRKKNKKLGLGLGPHS